MSFTDIITGLSFISMHVGLARLDKGLRQSIDIPEENLQAYVDLTARAAQLVTISNQIKQLNKKADKLKKEKLNAEHAQLMVQIGQLRLQHEHYKVDQKRLKLELEKERRQAQENQVLRIFIDFYDQALTYFQQNRFLDFLVLSLAMVRIYQQIYNDLDDANNRLKLTQLKENLYEKLHLAVETDQYREKIIASYSAALKNPYGILEDGNKVLQDAGKNLALVSDLHQIPVGEEWNSGIQEIDSCVQDLNQVKTEISQVENRFRDFSQSMNIQEFFFMIDNPGASEFESVFSVNWSSLLREIEARVGMSLSDIYRELLPLPDSLTTVQGKINQTIQTLGQLHNTYKLGDIATQLRNRLPEMEEVFAGLDSEFNMLAVDESTNPTAILEGYLILHVIYSSIHREMHNFPNYVIAQKKLSPKVFEERMAKPFTSLDDGKKYELASQFSRVHVLYKKYVQLEKDTSRAINSARKQLYKIVKSTDTYQKLYLHLQENFNSALLDELETEINQAPTTLSKRLISNLSSSSARDYRHRREFIDKYATAYGEQSATVGGLAGNHRKLPDIEDFEKSDVSSRRVHSKISWKLWAGIGVGIVLIMCLSLTLFSGFFSQNNKIDEITATIPETVEVAQNVIKRETTNTPQPVFTATTPPTYTSTALPSSTPTQSPLGTVLVNSGSINLRNGPGTIYKVVDSAKQGDQLDVFGVSEDQAWLVIDRDGQVWVAASVVKSDLEISSLPLVTPLPTATSTNTPIPTTTPTQKVIGLGISRSDVTSVFRSIGFSFKDGKPVDGYPQVSGTSDGGLAIVQLIGPEYELVEASIMIFLPNDAPDEVALNSAYTLGMTKLILPEWDGGSDWITNNLEKSLQSSKDTYEVTTRVSGIKVDLLVIKSLASVTVTFSK